MYRNFTQISDSLFLFSHAGFSEEKEKNSKTSRLACFKSSFFFFFALLLDSRGNQLSTF